MNFTCFYCDQPVDPLNRNTRQRIIGWEHKAATLSRKGGSDIELRERRDEYAHADCVALKRSGIDPRQVSLLPT